MDPWTYVLSRNVHRQHLSTGQRLALLEALPSDVVDGIRAEAEARIKDGKSPRARGRKGKASDELGRLVGLSGRTVERYEHVKREDPKLAQRVLAGTMTVREAEQRVARRKLVETTDEGPAGLKFRSGSTGAIKSAARALVKEYHYSGKLPTGTRAIGIFYDGDRPVAACCFGAAPARVWSQHPIMELNRLVLVPELDVALTSLISRTVESVWNSKELADILLLISYADATEGHYGGVYQAASWNYAGIRKSATTG